MNCSVCDKQVTTDEDVIEYFKQSCLCKYKCPHNTWVTYICNGLSTNSCQMIIRCIIAIIGYELGRYSYNCYKSKNNVPSINLSRGFHFF